MSLFESVTLACPSCGEPVEFEAVGSVNAARRPDLREAIVSGAFQREDCPNCDTSFRLDPEMVYLDVGKGQWIAVYPLEALGDWAGREAQAQENFAFAYGEEAPGPAKDIGEDLSPRVAFGWSALREKLVCAEQGIDDEDLELTKIAIMRGLENPPLGDGTELRLIEVDAEQDVLVMAWILAQSEEVVEMMRVPRSLYDEIADDQEDWEPLRQSLSAGFFVDMQRLIIASP